MAFGTSKIAALKGDTGAAGAAATIAVGTVSTGAAGTSVSVSNSGTSAAATFDFTIPRGDTGAAGTIDLTADQTWTGSQRGAVVGANTGVFDLSTSNNFSCTPSVNVELQFDTITAGQSGFIYLDNSNGKAITSETTSVMVDADILTTISATGKYLLSYFAVSSSKAAITGSKALS